jgi:UDPglucose 6-dehydrogenase
MTYKKIGIVGLGTVGGALWEWFKSRPVELLLYDKFKKIGSLEEVNQAEVIFICVPTPFIEGSGFDVSVVNEAVSVIIGAKIVVIKSTVVPGTTERLQKEFPQHKFLMNPEFLREVSAVEDMIHPERQVIGHTKTSQNLAPDILALLPPAPYTKIFSATAVELIKYFGNIFLASKVILANEIYDVCDNLGVNYEAVAEAVAHDSRIGTSHLKVDPSARGYGGKCLPKDVSAFAELTAKLGLESLLICAIAEHNRRYIQK